MKRAIVILAVAAMLAACSDTPTTPIPPLDLPDPPKIVSFTAAPSSIAPGDEVAIAFSATFEQRDGVGVRLDMGPEEADLILVFSQYEKRGEYPWLQWTEHGVSFSTRRWLTETKTIKLQIWDRFGSVVETRTVTVH